MADGTKIEWTDATWNPVRGCSRVSPGCDNCYAIGIAHRYQWGEGLTRIRKMTSAERAADKGNRTVKPDWSGRLHLLNDKLAEPLRWRKPRKVFVCSGADLFHHDVPFEFIAAVFGVMAACPQHTFQVLTKRPDRMLEFFEWVRSEDDCAHDVILPHAADRIDSRLWAKALVNTGLDQSFCEWEHWPLPNVWLGVSAEDEPHWDKRVPVLMQCPAAVRYVSAEPLIGRISVDLDDIGYRDQEGRMLDWLIAGAESGPGARPMDEDWVRKLRDDCQREGAKFFYKQKLEDGRKVGLPELDGRVWAEFPGVPNA